MVQYSSKVASHLVALKSVRRLVENRLEHSVDLAGYVALVSARLTVDAGSSACLSPVARVRFTRLNHRLHSFFEKRKTRRARCCGDDCVALSFCFHRRLCFAFCGWQRGTSPKTVWKPLSSALSCAYSLRKSLSALETLSVASCGHRLKTLSYDDFKIRKSELVHGRNEAH